MLHKIQDPSVQLHLRNAPGDRASFEVNGVTVNLKLVRDGEGAYVVFSADGVDEPLPSYRLWRAKKEESKAQTRQTTEQLIAEFKANGGKVTVADPNEQRKYNHRDWKRLQQGLKVATKEEIEKERERRSLIAIKNKDMNTVLKLLQGGFDREIKFDIEEGRVDADGNYHNIGGEPVNTEDEQ